MCDVIVLIPLVAGRNDDWLNLSTTYADEAHDEYVGQKGARHDVANSPEKQS